MRKRKAWVIVLVALIALSSMATAFSVDSAPSARVVFKAGEPDANGVFTVALTIYNAKFNVFQFVLRYDKSTVIPVNNQGDATSSFSTFSNKAPNTDWLATIGTSIDTGRGLIDFTGYVVPGNAISTDGLEKVSGHVNVGASGIEVFTFNFKKTSTKDIGLEIAKQDSQKPFSKYLPSGGAIISAGYDSPISVEFDLPSTIGKVDSDKIIPEKTQQPPSIDETMSKKERLRGTVALQIGNYGAAVGGVLVHIDSENKAVVPYIDENNRTMVPIRFIAERLGAEVDWKSESREIVITLGDKKIVMKVGAKEFTINGQKKSMDTVPIIKRGWNRTMVPIRFVSEELEMSVAWDYGNKLVVIAPRAKPWQLDREVEKKATGDILLVISPLVRDFL